MLPNLDYIPCHLLAEISIEDVTGFHTGKYFFPYLPSLTNREIVGFSSLDDDFLGNGFLNSDLNVVSGLLMMDLFLTLSDTDGVNFIDKVPLSYFSISQIYRQPIRCFGKNRCVNWQASYIETPVPSSFENSTLAFSIFYRSKV